MAEKFVRPLIETEQMLGHFSTLICDAKKCNPNTIQINFRINFTNFFYIIFHKYFFFQMYFSILCRGAILYFYTAHKLLNEPVHEQG